MLTAWMLHFALLFSSVLHPYYVSVTEIEYDLKRREVGVACKFFIDDREKPI